MEWWHHKLDARQSGLHLHRPLRACPACCTGYLGHSSAAPPVMHGSAGWKTWWWGRISDVASPHTHSIWDVFAILSRLGERITQRQIIWRCQVKVKKNYFGWIYRRFYSVLLPEHLLGGRAWGWIRPQSLLSRTLKRFDEGRHGHIESGERCKRQKNSVPLGPGGKDALSCYTPTM